MRRLLAACAAVVVLACGTPSGPVLVVPTPVEPPPAVAPAGPPVVASAPPRAAPTRSDSATVYTTLPSKRDAGAARIRVALSTALHEAHIGAQTAWELLDRDSATLVRASPGEQVRIERDGHRVRATRDDGSHTAWVDGPVVARAAGNGMLVEDGKRYRGDLLISGGDSALVVVNRLAIDAYLLGVVPLEIGPRTPAESAAVQAQAVAARSYAYTHLVAGGTVKFDVTATVLDQVYGGVDAETPDATEAVESTHGLVLKYAGRVINAPYHSDCGGITAEPEEVWRADSVPYLRRVSDQIPGTDRYYCDIAPRFKWTRDFTAAELNATVKRYLSGYATVPGGDPGRTKDVVVGSRTPSGRVGTLTLSTERGNFVLRGNDIRFVLRSTSGEILNSTYFSVETTRGSDGLLSALTVRGMGYGHGVGMCQWGAIGRARAGQDFQTILGTYFPGTTVGPIE